MTEANVEPRTSPYNITTELKAFLIDRRARGVSPRTIGFYREKLTVLVRWLASRGVTEMQSVTPDDLRQYLLTLGQTHNPGGVHAHFRAMRTLFLWYEAETEPQGWTNPIRKLHAPKLIENPLPPADLDDLQAMLASCERHTLTGDRDRALLMFLLDTGCRASEVYAMDLGDVSLETGAVSVKHGKGDKARTVFVGSKTRRAMVRYLRHRPDAEDDEPLWCTDEGRRFSYSGLRMMVIRRAARAGVKAPSLHSFRRAFALASLRAGVDLVSLSRLMGHADLSVLSRYLSQDDEDLRLAHAKGSPVDRL